MIIVFNQLKKKSGRLQRSGSELSDSKITSSASSSKRSADSTNLLEPDAADMYDIDTCLERDVNSQKKSRKTSKISRDDFKHHKKMSPTTKSSTSLLSQYYQEKICLKMKIGDYQLEFSLIKCTLASKLLKEMDSKDTTFLQYISWTTDIFGVI